MDEPVDQENAVERRKGRVLLGGADVPALMLLVSALHAEGFEVVATPRGQEALALNGQEQPDVVLVDEAFADMDGRAFYQRLLWQENPPPTILLLKEGISGKMPGLLDSPEAEQPGADIVLHKPIEKQEILSVVRGLIGFALAQRPTQPPRDGTTGS